MYMFEIKAITAVQIKTKVTQMYMLKIRVALTAVQILQINKQASHRCIFLK